MRRGLKNKMRITKNFTVPYRRKRKKKTDYKKRLALIKSKKLRLVIRPSTKNIRMQIVKYMEDGDRVLAHATSMELKKLGWEYSGGNIPAAYLTGFLLGRKAINAGYKDAIVDMGFSVSHAGNRVYAALKGAIDAGMDIPHNEKMLPPEERIKGGHIKGFVNVVKKGGYKNQFSKTKDKDIVSLFDSTLEKIKSGKQDKAAKKTNGLDD